MTYDYHGQWDKKTGHVDPVEVRRDGGNVVADVHDGLTGADGSREQQAARLEGVGQLPDPGGECGLVFVSLLLTLSLPAAGVLPVKVQAVEVVLLDELDGVLNELCPGRRVVDQPAVLVSLAVIPPTQGQGHLDPVLLELRHLPVHVLARVAVGHVCVRIMGLHEESVAVQHSEAVDDVSADSVIDVLGVELSAACLSIGGPICEVADDLVLAGEAVVKRAVVVVRSGRLRWRLPGLVPVLSGGGGCRGRGGSRRIFPLRKLRNDGLLGKVGHRDDGVGVPRLLITCLAFSTAGSLGPVTPLLIVVPVEAVTTLAPDPVLVHTQVKLPTLGGCLVGSLNAGDFEARLTVSVFVRTLVLESEVQ